MRFLILCIRIDILMPFSKYSQYPVVGRISAKGIKMFNHYYFFRINLSSLLKIVILQMALKCH